MTNSAPSSASSETRAHVLMAGGTLSAGFVQPLAAALRERYPVRFSAFGLHCRSPEEEEEAARTFEALLSPTFKAPPRRTFPADLIRAATGSVFGGRFRIPPTTLLEARLLLALRATWSRAALGRVDLFHVHYLDDVAARWVAAVDVRTPVVASFWGSDLLAPKPEHVPHVRAVLDVADAITVQTPEMREVVLERYGQHLAPRVTYGRFGAPQGWPPPAATEDERREAGLDRSTRHVVCGNSAAVRNQHLALLRGLKDLPEDVGRRFTFHLPMTYGSDVPGYLDEVKELARSLPWDVRVLDRFLPTRELQVLTSAADVFVYVTQTDALSATLSEHLATGSVCMVGDWLPYSLFEDAGCRLLRTPSAASVGHQLAELLPRLDDELERARANRAAVLRVVSWDAVCALWGSAYGQAARHSRSLPDAHPGRARSAPPRERA